MARRLSAAQIKKRTETNKAFVKIAFVVLILGLISYLYIRTISSQLTLDKVTLCPDDPKSLTVLLVDVTDPMNLPQKQDFINQLNRLVAQIPRHGKLVITKVDPVSEKLLNPVITRCNPGQGKDVSEFDGNPQLLDKDYKMKYLDPLNQAFSGLFLETEAKQSPILESIQSVALTEFQNPKYGEIDKKLVIVSDFLQNTSTISFLKGTPEHLKFLRSHEFQRVKTDLRAIDIEMWMLQRADFRRTQPRALMELWESIFREQNGNPVRIYNVSG